MGGDTSAAPLDLERYHLNEIRQPHRSRGNYIGPFRSWICRTWWVSVRIQTGTSLVEKANSISPPGRTKAVGPFVDPDPDFVVAKIGETHTLIFSKFCVPRPHLVLYTNQFELQSDDLTKSDLDSAWRVLEAFPKTPSMMICSCGVDAESSQGHKHMQVFPKPGGRDFKLFPCLANLPEGDVVTVPTVPY